MLINSKSQIAVRTMINVAKFGKSSPVSAEDLAARLKISKSYMEQILSKLNKAGLVVGTKGPVGGYRLAKQDVNVAQIIRAVNQQKRTNSKGWTIVVKGVGDKLKSIKLSDLLL